MKLGELGVGTRDFETLPVVDNEILSRPEEMLDYYNGPLAGITNRGILFIYWGGERGDARRDFVLIQLEPDDREWISQLWEHLSIEDIQEHLGERQLIGWCSW